MRIFRPRHCSLREDQSGATLIEFALVSPVLLVLIMGTLDLGHQLYTRAVLVGEMQKAGRDSALETGSAQASALDAQVTNVVKAVSPTATVSFSRNSFRDFSDAAASEPEEWTDTNSDGTCNAGEPYSDANNNGIWDADGGNDGQGGAKDAVVYTATVTYPRIFPMAGLAGLSSNVTLTASTILRNQPYADQDESDATLGNCT